MQTQAEGKITQGRQRPAHRRHRFRQRRGHRGQRRVQGRRRDRLRPPRQGWFERLVPHVSFDNVGVGKLIGQGEVDCIAAWKVTKPNILVMDGDATDNNATLFAPGVTTASPGVFYRRRHPPLRQGRRAGRHVGPADRRHDVRAAVHRPSLTSQRRHHATDDNANAASSPASSRRPTDPGQDVPDHRAIRTPRRGLQNILKGYQCGTVYKAIYLEAQAAAAVAIYLRAGEKPPSGLVNGPMTDARHHGRRMGAAHPGWVMPDNMASSVVWPDGRRRKRLTPVSGRFPPPPAPPPASAIARQLQPGSACNKARTRPRSTASKHRFHGPGPMRREAS